MIYYLSKWDYYFFFERTYCRFFCKNLLTLFSCKTTCP